jgi:hypothetical protein
LSQFVAFGVFGVFGVDGVDGVDGVKCIVWRESYDPAYTHL